MLNDQSVSITTFINNKQSTNSTKFEKFVNVFFSNWNEELILRSLKSLKSLEKSGNLLHYEIDLGITQTKIWLCQGCQQSRQHVKLGCQMASINLLE